VFSERGTGGVGCCLVGGLGGPRKEGNRAKTHISIIGGVRRESGIQEIAPPLLD